MILMRIKKRTFLSSQRMLVHDRGGNRAGKGSSVEVSDGKEEYVIREWTKDNPCYKVE